jgi:hypothetical protein
MFVDDGSSRLDGESVCVEGTRSKMEDAVPSRGGVDCASGMELVDSV